LRLPIDVFPCEDGHAQERSLLKAVYPTVEINDAWVADRNFCIIEFTCNLWATLGLHYSVFVSLWWRISSCR
jgi:hypothetical protein